MKSEEGRWLLTEVQDSMKRSCVKMEGEVGKGVTICNKVNGGPFMNNDTSRIPSK